MRIGQGFDAHQLVSGRACIIGGVSINHPYGLQGHSDADVLLHAIMDAMLGALALGDIGQYFPSHDATYHNSDSRHLLRQIVALVHQQGWQVHNLDSTVICQAPQLSPYIAQMRQHIASDCAVSINQISVKATTTDHLGFTGRGEGIAAQAICLLLPKMA